MGGSHGQEAETRSSVDSSPSGSSASRGGGSRSRRGNGPAQAGMVVGLACRREQDLCQRGPLGPSKSPGIGFRTGNPRARKFRKVAEFREDGADRAVKRANRRPNRHQSCQRDRLARAEVATLLAGGGQRASRPGFQGVRAAKKVGVERLRASPLGRRCRSPRRRGGRRARRAKSALRRSGGMGSRRIVSLALPV